MENDKLISALNDTINQSHILENERLEILSFENKIIDRKTAYRRKVLANDLKRESLMKRLIKFNSPMASQFYFI
jgi:hypothetical protein